MEKNITGVKSSKPEWLKVKLPSKPKFWSTKNLISHLKLHTVCEEAQCPNRWECWTKGTASFMIAGDACTRSCGFCTIKTSKPLPLDEGEPERLAQAAANMKLSHIVITAVTRDDLEDGGSKHFYNCILAIREKLPLAIIEVLTPDFQGNIKDIETVIDAKPEVFNHNVETIQRLSPSVRSQKADYQQSLKVLKNAREIYDSRGLTADKSYFTKSGFMVGLGETEEEVYQLLDDLYTHGVNIITIGQYLQPSKKHLEVQEFVSPEIFQKYKEVAESKGFRSVASAPLVRSSYNAQDVFPSAKTCQSGI